ncbi:Qat anti-phage system QueC-like protein QatC [Mesorhizobium sp. M00.F.Ca.ET.217.01.1.1]|uniref:Qat anti-phage system QueC-like protein QatC n=1 Tax=Mesorhizobium sp. M00.F.Ca.ET.217.01.1.1 TaxID=2500529 RepID=UPI000FD7D1ED|nr:Qat anti-phage system QueC-like protein QatC [Mesorhizobium sp. M00.F.Ca.ET.217.01.1.1]TGQ13577.1 hypothetical protein EN860_030555 [Mesorhizobium sp. M00.F.Ca.ET.217.01.1.1]TGV85441.1 hypothetical protein EN801_029260 [Mesorhizobium sp. M00.F.Ca.ET.158.01.1.1]
MRRFTFVARLGVGDNTAISLVQRDSTVIEVQFIGAYQRLEYGLGSALDFLKARDLKPSEVAVDLMILAALVNAADTRVSRVRNSQNGWTREIDLIVPVSDRALWTAQAGALGEMLRFLTGDYWRIFFRQRPSGPNQIAATPTRLPLQQFDEVCLFSGGLDSLIGAIDLIAGGRKPLLVSHWYDAETSKAQKAVWSKLEGRYSNAGVKVMRTRLGFDRYQVQTGEIENTQRGRSFVFFALAALAASALTGTVRIVVPENGFIGLNVPLDPLRLGALSTRTTHPHYFAMFNALLGRLGITATLDNPYRHKTKGEMVEECADMALLTAAVPLSMSCSSPAKARYRSLSPRHCGTCVPCLIRRAALKRGLSTKDPTLYLVPDLEVRRLDTTRAEGEHIRSFELMVARLSANPACASALARIPGPLNDEPAEVNDFVEVFRRGILEVGELLDAVEAAPG